MTVNGHPFPGPAGMLGAEAVKVALEAGVGGNSALLFGRMCSYNGKPFWELRVNLAEVFRVSKRTITRYFSALVDVGLIVNQPAPLGAIHPGCSRALPFRPWYKWAIGLPQLREAVKIGSKDAYARWLAGFEARRQERVTRAKLGAIIGAIVAPKPRPMAKGACMTAAEIDAQLANISPSKPAELPSYTYRPASSESEVRQRRLTSDEIDAELSSSAPPKPAEPRDTS